MIRPTLAALVLLIAAGCASDQPPRTITLTETIEVKVPVPVRADVPDALTARIDVPTPSFVSPTDPAATSALTAEGEQRLRSLLIVLKGRIDALKAWAADEPP